MEKIKKNPYDKAVMKSLRDGLKFADPGKIVAYFNTKVK